MPAFPAGRAEHGRAAGFIWRKYSELVNLRLLARGTGIGMPANAIREGMVLV